MNAFNQLKNALNQTHNESGKQANDFLEQVLQEYTRLADQSDVFLATKQVNAQKSFEDAQKILEEEKFC